MCRFFLRALTPVCVVMILSLATSVYALRDWEYITADARSSAMAGTDLATASGATANLTNAAPLLSGRSVQYSFTRCGDLEDTPGIARSINYQDMSHHALALEYKGFRASYSSADMTWGYSFRQGYDPVDSISPYSLSRKTRINVAGLSYDLSRLVAADSERFTWVVGVNHRSSRYSRINGGSRVSRYWNMDLGTTVCWSSFKPTRRLDFIGTITGLDILGDYKSYHPHSYSEPRAFRIGGTIRLQESYDSQWLRSFEASIGILRVQSSGREKWDNCTNIGGEVILSDVLAFRVGEDTSGYYYSRLMQYGAGLRTPRWLFENYGLSFDYSWNEYGNEEILTVGGWANF